MATASGLDGHDYESVGAFGSSSIVGANPKAHAALSGAWQQTLDLCLDVLADGLTALASAGATPPDVGMELADDKGQVLADSELCWLAQKLAVLRPDQSDMTHEWKAAGWDVKVLDEGLVSIDRQPWHAAVANGLGLHAVADQGAMV